MQQNKWTSVIVHADLEHLRKVPRNVLSILEKHKRMLVCIEMEARERMTEPQIKMVTGCDCMNYASCNVYNIRDVINGTFRTFGLNNPRSYDHLIATDIEDSDVETEPREPDLC